MSRDEILKGPDGTLYSADNLCAQKWLEGQAEGVRAVIGYLKNRAVELFKDEKALEMRKLANQIESQLLPQLIDTAQKHSYDFPSVIKSE